MAIPLLITIGSLGAFVAAIAYAGAGCGGNREGICGGAIFSYVMLPAFGANLLGCWLTILAWRRLPTWQRMVGALSPALLVLLAIGLVFINVLLER